MAARNVCLIDNCLKDFTGHHFEYIRSVAAELQSRQTRVLVLARQKALADFDRFFPVERVFRRSHYDWPCRIRKIGFFANLWILNRSFYSDLESALRDRVGPDWLLFAPNVNHQELFAWAWWLRKIPVSRRPQVRLFMRWSYYQQEDATQGQRYTFVAERAFRLLERFPTLKLVTDSSRLADEYSRLTRLPIGVLPIPHTGNTNGNPSAPHHPPVVVFLGGARSEKGFSILVEAARQMKDDKIQLVLQCHRDDPDDADAAKAHEELERLSGQKVRLVPEPLDSARYYELLASADIVVIPYRVQNYRARTSGILVEALAAGKPVVVTNGTWMADQTVPEKVGVTFEDGNARDLRRAILELASSLEAYRQRALDHRSRWLSFHNPSRLVEMLLS
jgi:glycosyltransferase involved in cell wall biosynthesis